MRVRVNVENPCIILTFTLALTTISSFPLSSLYLPYEKV